MKRLVLVTALFLGAVVGAQAMPCQEQQIISAAASAKAKIPLQYRNPAMMAIGDSMYNGVTSLTIDQDRAKLSVPALVASTLGIQFRVPAYKRPILVNLEYELGRPTGILLFELGPDVMSNIAAWQSEYPAPTGSSAGKHGTDLFFDNISIAGADSDELLCTTSGIADGVWRGKNIPPKLFGLPDFGMLFPLHENINSSFLLNPEDKPEFSGLSQMAEVVARVPTRLLINIGSNDGVWMAAFEGIEPPSPELTNLIANMGEIAKLIPEGTKYVYISNLVPPSRTPNLDPTSASMNTCAGNPYFASYEPYVGVVRPVSGSEACNLDGLIAGENTKIRNAVLNALKDRIARKDITVKFVDFNGLLWRFDRKNHPQPGDPNAKTVNVTWRGAARQLDNRVVHPAYAAVPKAGRPAQRASGGISGYDNMHPTMVMYGVGAKLVLDEILAAEVPAPHAVVPVPSLNLPQCVSYALTGTQAPQACPNLHVGHSVTTALDMDSPQDFKLIAAHELLAGISAQAVGRVAAANVKPNSVDLQRLRDTGDACALVRMFELVGHPATSPVKVPLNGARRETTLTAAQLDTCARSAALLSEYQ
jgi:hypothetical protein